MKRDYVVVKRLHRVRGRAALHHCARADASCRGAVFWANISGEYLGIDDFFPLCQSHLRRHCETPEWRAAMSAAWTPERRAEQAEKIRYRPDHVSSGKKGACGLHQISQGKPCVCGMHGSQIVSKL